MIATRIPLSLVTGLTLLAAQAACTSPLFAQQRGGPGGRPANGFRPALRPNRPAINPNRPVINLGPLAINLGRAAINPGRPAVTPIRPNRPAINPGTGLAGVKFSHGVYYKGNAHPRWARTFFSPKWGRTFYYSPAALAWYYWYAPRGVYYPASYLSVATPAVGSPVRVAVAGAQEEPGDVTPSVVPDPELPDPPSQQADE
jgi:hypothetical protein